jgi:hypothetical protein
MISTFFSELSHRSREDHVTQRAGGGREKRGAQRAFIYELLPSKGDRSSLTGLGATLKARSELWRTPGPAGRLNLHIGPCTDRSVSLWIGLYRNFLRVVCRQTPNLGIQLMIIPDHNDGQISKYTSRRWDFANLCKFVTQQGGKETRGPSQNG